MAIEARPPILIISPNLSAGHVLNLGTLPAPTCPPGVIGPSVPRDSRLFVEVAAINSGITKKDLETCAAELYGLANPQSLDKLSPDTICVWINNKLVIEKNSLCRLETKPKKPDVGAPPPKPKETTKPAAPTDQTLSSRVGPDPVSKMGGRDAKVGYVETRIGEIQIEFDRILLGIVDYLKNPDIIKVLVPIGLTSPILLFGFIRAYFEIIKKEKSAGAETKISLPRLMAAGTTEDELNPKTVEKIFLWIKKMDDTMNVGTEEFILPDGIEVYQVRLFFKNHGLENDFSVSDRTDRDPAFIRIGKRIHDHINMKDWDHKRIVMNTERLYQTALDKYRAMQSNRNLGRSTDEPNRLSSGPTIVKDILGTAIANVRGALTETWGKRLAEKTLTGELHQQPTEKKRQRIIAQEEKSN